MTKKINFSQLFGMSVVISSLGLVMGAVAAVLFSLMFSIMPAQAAVVSAEESTACVEITETLRRGMRDGVQGGSIAALQRFLAVEPVSGIFGPLTEAAVAQWQQAQGIVTEGIPETTGLGVVGPKTRAALGLLCGQASTLPVTADEAPRADFYFDTTQAPVLVTPALDCPEDEVCGLLQLSGTMTADAPVVLVELGNENQSATITYDAQTDSYTGSIDYSAVLAHVAEQGESCPCLYPILPESGSAPALPGYEQWTYVLPVVAGQTYRLALFNSETGALFDYAVIAPTAVAAARTLDEVVTGARVVGTATTVDALVVRIATPEGQTVYESKPVAVEGGRWWHRITESLSANVYQIFLETPDGTPVFSAPYQP